MPRRADRHLYACVHVNVRVHLYVSRMHVLQCMHVCRRREILIATVREDLSLAGEPLLGADTLEQPA